MRLFGNRIVGDSNKLRYSIFFRLIAEMLSSQHLPEILNHIVLEVSVPVGSLVFLHRDERDLLSGKSS